MKKFSGKIKEFDVFLNLITIIVGSLLIAFSTQELWGFLFPLFFIKYILISKEYIQVYEIIFDDTNKKAIFKYNIYGIAMKKNIVINYDELKIRKSFFLLWGPMLIKIYHLKKNVFNLKLKIRQDFFKEDFNEIFEYFTKIEKENNE